MRLSCAFAPSPETPEHVRIAESLGYANAWAYDSPAVYLDVWATLCLAAERTLRIGLGPAVVVPSLRHPVVTAASIATLYALAPGRINAAIGTGFTGRRLLGQPRMRWQDVEAYVHALRQLLRGEDAVWDGAVTRMMQPDTHGPARPIDVPLLIAADGPKGLGIARELGDGVFSSLHTANTGMDWHAVITFGTVVDEREDLASPRVVEAAGPALAVVFHSLYDQGQGDGLPGFDQWRAAVEETPPERRHLAMHEGHLVALTDRDRAAVTAASSLLPQLTFTGTRAQLRARLAALEEAGVTEFVYQPSGPDVPAELERMAAALGT